MAASATGAASPASAAGGGAGGIRSRVHAPPERGAASRVSARSAPRLRPTSGYPAASIAPCRLAARGGDGRIVGTLTLLLLATPGATFGFVEDVVVDEPVRGKGIGEALVRECQRLAAEQRACRIELHSGNHRQPAIRLHQRVGFTKFETNVWRYVVDT
ncbi:MAG: GNAT family N-acetyltransferase [Chloroflexi bacterium]|nr:GNAT family N-acetyltransferase [Chloroflexota bacterium]